jgi:hypothetical protein
MVHRPFNRAHKVRLWTAKKAKKSVTEEFDLAKDQ